MKDSILQIINTILAPILHVKKEKKGELRSPFPAHLRPPPSLTGEATLAVAPPLRHLALRQQISYSSFNDCLSSLSKNPKFVLQAISIVDSRSITLIANQSAKSYVNKEYYAEEHDRMGLCASALENWDFFREVVLFELAERKHRATSIAKKKIKLAAIASIYVGWKITSRNFMEKALKMISHPIC
ncbi:hypothetical protein R6Q59_020985 [Mikania micrantha]